MNRCQLITATSMLLLVAATAVTADPYQETFLRINAVRQKHGLSKLAYNEKLAQAAQSKADWMAQAGKMVHLRGKQATSFEAWKRSHHHPVNRIILAGYTPWDKLFSLETRNGRQLLVSNVRRQLHFPFSDN